MTPESHNYHSERPRSMTLHPYNIFLTLTLVGITVLFLAFSAAYIYSRIQGKTPPVKVPFLFVLNTLILLGSSYTINMAKNAYKTDDTEGYQKALIYTIILSVFFMLMQGIGWKMLIDQNVSIQSSNAAGYLYVISGMHFAHVIAGLPFLLLFLYTAKKQMVEPVSVLVYFSDPEKRLKLRLLTIYWHFLDILWIYLIVFFYLNYLIQ